MVPKYLILPAQDILVYNTTNDNRKSPLLNKNYTQAHIHTPWIPSYMAYGGAGLYRAIAAK